MQVLAETSYQDLYRITDGVLLVVNKFVPIQYPNMSRPIHLYSREVKQKKYAKGCQDALKILRESYYCRHEDITVKKGTVTYYGVPVEIAKDKNDYRYQIKTTGDLFSGNAEEMVAMLNDIITRIMSDNSE